MDDNKHWSNTGEQIKGALADALQSGDFKNLNELVSQTVTEAVGKPISILNNNPASKSRETDAAGPYGKTYTARQQDIPIWQQRAQEREERKRNQELQRRQDPAQHHRNLPSIKLKRVGNISNVLYQVFGGIGLGITGLVTLIRFFALMAGETTLGGWITNLVFLFGFYSMVRLGVGQKRRLKRAERYLQLCDYRVYGQIENLAKGTGKSKNFVLKDLEKMLALGIFPEGHLDEQKTCFMLNDVVYRQYLEAENNRRLRELETRKALEDRSLRNQNISETVRPEPEPSVSAKQKSELQTMIDEGTDYIRKLRNLNDRIPGEVISAKLFCLENLLMDIFESVKQHPEQMDRMHKLISYYLPTTLKLVESYEKFDKISSPGPDIIKAKTEIENTLDTINQAFRELLNNLFQDTVFDVTTDAQVLKTMLAKEGLTRDMDFTGFEQNS